MLNAERGGCLRGSLFRTEGSLLLISVLIALNLSCRSEASAAPTVDPVQSELRTAIAGTFTVDELKVEFARLAVRVAQSGCVGVDERLSGGPARLLVSMTDSAVAGKLISSVGKFQHGPGGSGSVPVLVIAIEGPIEPVVGLPSSRDRAFVFVEPLVDSDFSTCLVREAPLSLDQTDFSYGSFEFELLELR